MNDNELYLDNNEFYRSERKRKNNVSAHSGVFVGITEKFRTRKVDFETKFFGGISGCSLHVHEKNLLYVHFTTHWLRVTIISTAILILA